MYQASNTFINPTIVSMFSLLSNYSGSEPVRFYLFCKDFSEEDKAKFKWLESQFPSCSVVFLPTPDLASEKGLVFDTYNGKWPITSFTKAFVDAYIPESVDKLLYCDGDILVCKDLKELWETDLGDNYFAGVKDPLGPRYMEVFGLAKDDLYVNSGFLLFNLKKMREEGFSTKIVEYSKKQNGFIFFSEQTALNVVANKRILPLPLKYNVQTLPLSLTKKQFIKLRRNYFDDSDEDVKNAIEGPTVLHMSTCFLMVNRPWFEKNNYRYKNKFDFYAKQVPFFEYAKDRRPPKKRGVSFFVRIAPRFLLASFVGWLYNGPRINRWLKFRKASYDGLSN